MEESLLLAVVPGRFAICRLEPGEPLPTWATETMPYSITRTADELSVVCRESALPPGTAAERDWRCLRVEDTLDFGLVGILSGIAGALARAQVSIFVISTFNTDYFLVKSRQLPSALEALRRAGYDVREPGSSGDG
jgi:hypothetical protein